MFYPRFWRAQKYIKKIIKMLFRKIDHKFQPAGWQGMKGFLNEIPEPSFEDINFAVGLTRTRRG